MGSSACYHLAKGGVSVIGIEQFRLGHDRGSSHGETRMIRQAYFEHPDYVPLLQRSYTLWDELSASTQKKLLHRNGILYLGKPGSEIMDGIRVSAALHDLSIEELSPDDGGKRFPQFALPPDFDLIFEKDAGFLEVDNCVVAYATEAKRAGAQIQEQERVLDWQEMPGGIEVITDRDRYSAGRLVITSGAWRNEKTSLLDTLTVHRNLVFWFSCGDMFSEAQGMPCFGLDGDDGFVYGFPKVGAEGMKVAHHAPGDRVVDPFRVERNTEPEEALTVERSVESLFPQVKGPFRRAQVCLYTMSSDGHFIVDKLPEHERVVFAAGFSGHGFKFASVMGEVLSELSVKGKSRHPVEFLRLNRFYH